MAYERLDKKYVDGQVWDGDAVTRIDDAFSDLNDRLEYVTPVDEIILTWENGGIDTNSGVNTNASNRRRTSDYIPLEVCLLTTTSSVTVAIATYDASQAFVSAIKNNSNVWHTFTSGETIDITSFNVPTDAMFYRLLLNSSSGATGEEITVSYPYEEVRTGIIPDIEQLQKIVGVPTEEEPYTNVAWESGGIDTNSGVNSSYGADTRQRTAGYIPISVSKINLDASATAMVVFYDESKTFITGTYSWTTYSGVINISNINLAKSASYYRVALNISSGTTGENLNFATPAGVTTGILKQLEELSGGSSGSGKPNEIIVDCNGNGDYTTIEDALANAGDTETNHVIIRVMQGTYYPAPKTDPNNVPYTESYRNLSIIGDNKNKVILRGDCGYYYYQIGVDHAILRLNGNVTIENLTIESYCSDYETTATENGWDLTSPHCRAYCIHVDASWNEGDMVLIKNCRLINDHFTTIGFGLRQNCTLRIEDCDLIMTVSDNSLSGGANYGTLYGHLHANKAALNQRFEVINCRIINNSYSQAINLMDASGQTEEGACSATAQLIGNVCKTTDTQNGFKMNTTYGYWSLDDLCYGNNIESMNVIQ